ncbi:hypothetical protein M9H77_02923 [Catharanthus roseus]|uniref:Uncharacterized protein n=1 Tax=Catharanthus roseus TaxID=4058 RepID=A0ACC0C9R8_CATRO|nr:hypothetical protein M9H77_02923 [Catharanthus roseus]
MDSDDIVGVEGRRGIEKKLGPILEDLSISLSLNPSSLCYEVSLEELKSLLDSYNLQMSLIGDMFIIAFEGNLSLLGLSMTNLLSSHFSLEDPLMSSSTTFDPSCYGFGKLNATSLVELNIIGFALEFGRNSLQHVCTITSTRGKRHTMEWKGQELNAYYVILVGDCMYTLFTYELVLDIDHMLKYSSSCAFLEKQLMFKGGFVENCDYESSFLYTSKKNFDGFIPSIKLLCLKSHGKKNGRAALRKIVISKRMIQDLAWQVIENQEQDFKKSKNLSIFKVTNGRIQGSKHGRVGSFKHKRGSRFWTPPPTVGSTLPSPVASSHKGLKTKGPTTDSRLGPTIAVEFRFANPANSTLMQVWPVHQLSYFYFPKLLILSHRLTIP